ncbi:Ras- protein Rab-33A [Xenoophorus captivus]|uniref:Ras- protein Rab-33A n=1 Tax=Xenoophorus captivus TaxID=1517983 RepID=A0ABV0QW81_9TELE
MAIENNPEEEFDTVFSLNDSLQLSSHSEQDCGKARIFKIIVIGDSNVGKTCLTYRFCGGTFLKNPEATIGVDFRERTVELDGERIKVRGHISTVIRLKGKHALPVVLVLSGD